MYFLLCIWGNSRRKPFVSRSHTTHIAAISVRGVQVPFCPSHLTTPQIDFLSIRSRLELKTCFLHQNSSNIPKFRNLVGGSFLGWVAPGRHSEPCPTVQGGKSLKLPPVYVSSVCALSYRRIHCLDRLDDVWHHPPTGRRRSIDLNLWKYIGHTI